jgi:peroxiredoxin Q/BCP
MKRALLVLMSILCSLLAEPIAKGEKAPLFSLIDQNGINHSLYEHLGKSAVVLVFYPADNSPRCTEQLCEIRDNYESMLKFDSAVVYGVNSADIESHRAFAEEKKYPFSLLVDEGWKTAKLYGVNGGLFGVKRWVFIIDKNGIVQLSKKGKPPVEELLQALEEL